MIAFIFPSPILLASWRVTDGILLTAPPTKFKPFQDTDKPNIHHMNTKMFCQFPDIAYSRFLCGIGYALFNQIKKDFKNR